MARKAATSPKAAIRPFRFESYGVAIEITGNDQGVIDEAAAVARRCLLGKVTELSSRKTDRIIELERLENGVLRLTRDNEPLASGRSKKKFFKFLDGIIRITVGEYAPDRVFMHSGAVGWNGKAIVMPGDSFKGKSTLVAELVRNGAEYYSDDFAIFDKDGMLHPFPRALAMRKADRTFKDYSLTAESLGGETGTTPIPVGMILVTGYAPGARWKPQMLTAGQGILEMMPHILSVRRHPEFVVKVLNNVVNSAIIASSPRGTAEKFAKILLNFVDKHEI